MLDTVRYTQYDVEVADEATKRKFPGLIRTPTPTNARPIREAFFDGTMGVAMADLISDSELIAGVQNGDSLAFSELDAKWRPILFGMFVRKLSNNAYADDLVQETLFRVWKKSALYNAESGTFGAWIRRIASNVLVDSYRSKGRTVKADVLEFNEPEQFDNAADTNEAVELVREAVLDLPESMRLPMELYLSGKTISQISRETGATLGSVKGRIFQAQQRMRNSATLLEFVGIDQDVLQAA
jgi:RNA polymerase sigma-70 factor (ECF subfamily)